MIENLNEEFKERIRKMYVVDLVRFIKDDWPYDSMYRNFKNHLLDEMVAAEVYVERMLRAGDNYDKHLP